MKVMTITDLYYRDKGDGLYIGLLNNGGTVRDWKFFKEWASSG